MRITVILLALAVAILLVTGTVSCKGKQTSTQNNGSTAAEDRNTDNSDSTSGDNGDRDTDENETETRGTDDEGNGDGEDEDGGRRSRSDNLEPESEEPMSRGALRRLSDSLDIDIGEGTDLTYRVGDTEIEVKKMIPENEDDLVDLFDAVFLDSGTDDAVLLAEDGVYRVISDDADAGKEVIASLDDLAPLQDVKINPFVLGDAGDMISDAVVDSDGVDEISRSLDLGVDAVLNQFVDMDGRRIQVNFILPGNNATADEILNKLIEEKGSERGLYTIGDAVIEMPRVNEETARTIWDLINSGR